MLTRVHYNPYLYFNSRLVPCECGLILGRVGPPRKTCWKCWSRFFYEYIKELKQTISQLKRNRSYKWSIGTHDTHLRPRQTNALNCESSLRFSGRWELVISSIAVSRVYARDKRIPSVTRHTNVSTAWSVNPTVEIIAEEDLIIRGYYKAVLTLTCI